MNKRQIISGALVIIAIIFLLVGKETKEVKIEGLIFGTIYHIIYADDEDRDLQLELENHLKETVDNSLSTYNKTSIISRINQNDTTVSTNNDFEKVFNCGQVVSKNTNGAFDMTVAPLVNLWGFGFTKKDSITQEKINHLLSITGYKTVTLSDHKLSKQFSETMLDASAIAKGYAVDVASNFLESHGITNYIVEIGGEIYCNGKNSRNKKWHLAIDKPIDDPTVSNRKVENVLILTGKGVATSGNYRNFYIKDGEKYSHTINPSTGYPVNHNLLSATVVADNCMTADAYATGCMVLGVEESKKLAQRIPEIEIFLIYADEKGDYKEYWSSGMEKYLQIK